MGILQRFYLNPGSYCSPDPIIRPGSFVHCSSNEQSAKSNKASHSFVEIVGADQEMPAILVKIFVCAFLGGAKYFTFVAFPFLALVNF